MLIQGVVRKIYYSSAGFSSVRFETDSPVHYNRCRYSSIMVAGTFPNPVEKCRYEVEGDFVEDPKYGLQFKPSNVSLIGNDIYSMKVFLQSGFVTGLGPVLAERLLDRFGVNSFDIIENDYNRLSEIKGISPEKAKKIHNSFVESRAYMKLMNFFNGTVTENTVLKIYEKYGNDAIKKIKENPYTLIYDIDGFGFKKADDIAIKSGISLDDPRRIKGAITYALSVASQSGHCFLYLSDIVSMITELISNIEVDDNIITNQIVLLVKEGKICVDDERIYLGYLNEAETYLANKLKALLVTPKNKVIKDWLIEDIISKEETDCGYTLEEKQRKAIKLSLSQNVSIITGGPGTGKTTIINLIIKAWGANDVVLAAPTGRASRRMAETSGCFAQTLHRWITQYKVNKIKSKNSDEKIKNKLIIIDEASMLDVRLICDFLHYVDDNCKIVFVGDIDQLPSIQAGNFFRDIVNSPIIPTTKLTLSHRVKGSVAINAHHVNNGESMNSFVYNDDFIYYPTQKTDMQKKIIDEYLKMYDNNNIQDIQLIVPMRQRGTTSSNVLNELIREKVNPSRGEKYTFTKFRVSDRVMCTTNDYDLEVFNGDCGVILNIDPLECTVEIMMDSGKTIVVNKLQVSNFVLAYAITIHKSQGSEYKEVLMAISYEHYTMLQRNLLYTAMTRTKGKLVLIGETAAINKAISNVTPIHRNTYLKERLMMR